MTKRRKKGSAPAAVEYQSKGTITMPDTFNMIVLMDWGTETLRWTAGDEDLSMPNIAVSPSQCKPVCAVGNDAIQLLKVHPEYYVLMPPAGILFDNPDAIDAQSLTMMCLAGKKLPRWKRLLHPKVLAAVPLGTSGIETFGFRDVLKREAQKVVFVEAPMAAAMGAGYDGYADDAFPVLDIGAGFTQFAVIRQGGFQVSGALRIGGRDLDRTLKKYLFKQYTTDFSFNELREVKHTWNRHNTFSLGKLRLERDEQQSVWLPHWERVAELIDETLTDAELRREVAANGVALTGGLSQMLGFPEFLAERFGMKFQVARNPAGAVLRGLQRMLTKLPPDLWK